MKNNFVAEFSVEATTNSLLIAREFGASLPEVWDAWTKADILDQWWAPKPFKTKTKSQVFGPNGHWHYEMQGPNGESHWGFMNYKEINLHLNYTATDFFCDENAVRNEQFPSTDWKVTFTSLGNTTQVNIVSVYASAEAIEQILAMGMKEGMTQALQQLDELLDI